MILGLIVAGLYVVTLVGDFKEAKEKVDAKWKNRPPVPGGEGEKSTQEDVATGVRLRAGVSGKERHSPSAAVFAGTNGRTNDMKDEVVKAWKLFRVRKDGSLGPLFINASLRVPEDKWMPSEAHKTPGFPFRPGWHACLKPVAPRLTGKGRIWCEVELRGVTKYDRPESQGGEWLLAKALKVVARRPDVSHSWGGTTSA